MERTCKKCGETKPIEEFHKRNNCKYGYGFDCELCFKKYKQNHYAINKTKICKENNEYRKSHLGQSNYYSKKYRDAHKKQAIIRQRKYREENPEKQIEYGRKYYWQNPEKHKHQVKKSCLIHSERVKRYRNAWSSLNKGYIKEKNLKRSETLPDSTVASWIKGNTGISLSTIKQHPKFIESYRQQIKVKRLLKSKKNDKSIETS